MKKKRSLIKANLPKKSNKSANKKSSKKIVLNNTKSEFKRGKVGRTRRVSQVDLNNIIPIRNSHLPNVLESRINEMEARFEARFNKIEAKIEELIVVVRQLKMIVEEQNSRNKFVLDCDNLHDSIEQYKKENNFRVRNIEEVIQEIKIVNSQF